MFGHTVKFKHQEFTSRMMKKMTTTYTYFLQNKIQRFRLFRLIVAFFSFPIVFVLKLEKSKLSNRKWAKMNCLFYNWIQSLPLKQMVFAAVCISRTRSLVRYTYFSKKSNRDQIKFHKKYSRCDGIRIKNEIGQISFRKNDSADSPLENVQSRNKKKSYGLLKSLCRMMRGLLGKVSFYEHEAK